MSEKDIYASNLLEEAKRFLEKAQVETSLEGKQAYLQAALVIGYSALEAHIYSIADDFSSRSEFSVLEKSLIYERDYFFKDGEFVLSDQLRMYRLEDRICFLYKRFTGRPLDKTQKWWVSLKSGIRIRNNITHPREKDEITEILVEGVLTAIIESIDVLYHAVFGKRFPATGKELNSSMDF